MKTSQDGYVNFDEESPDGFDKYRTSVSKNQDDVIDDEVETDQNMIRHENVNQPNVHDKNSITVPLDLNAYEESYQIGDQFIVLKKEVPEDIRSVYSSSSKKFKHIEENSLSSKSVKTQKPLNQDVKRLVPLRKSLRRNIITARKTTSDRIVEITPSQNQMNRKNKSNLETLKILEIENIENMSNFGGLNRSIKQTYETADKDEQDHDGRAMDPTMKGFKTRLPTTVGQMGLRSNSPSIKNKSTNSLNKEILVSNDIGSSLKNADHQRQTIDSNSNSFKNSEDRSSINSNALSRDSWNEVASPDSVTKNSKPNNGLPFVDFSNEIEEVEKEDEDDSDNYSYCSQTSEQGRNDQYYKEGWLEKREKALASTKQYQDELKDSDDQRLLTELIGFKQDRIRRYVKSLKYSYQQFMIYSAIVIICLNYHLSLIYFMPVVMGLECKSFYDIACIRFSAIGRDYKRYEKRHFILMFSRVTTKFFFLITVMPLYYFYPDWTWIALIPYMIYLILSLRYEFMIASGSQTWFNMIVRLTKICRVVFVLHAYSFLRYYDPAREFRDQFINDWYLWPGLLVMGYLPCVSTFVILILIYALQEYFTEPNKYFSTICYYWIILKSLMVLLAPGILYGLKIYLRYDDSFFLLTMMYLLFGSMLLLYLVPTFKLKDCEDFFSQIVDEKVKEKHEDYQKSQAMKIKNDFYLDYQKHEGINTNIDPNSVEYITKQNDNVYKKFTNDDVKELMKLTSRLDKVDNKVKKNLQPQLQYLRPSFDKFKNEEKDAEFSPMFKQILDVNEGVTPNLTFLKKSQRSVNNNRQKKSKLGGSVRIVDNTKGNEQDPIGSNYIKPFINPLSTFSSKKVCRSSDNTFSKKNLQVLDKSRLTGTITTQQKSKFANLQCNRNSLQMEESSDDSPEEYVHNEVNDFEESSPKLNNKPGIFMSNAMHDINEELDENYIGSFESQKRKVIFINLNI